MSAQPLVLLYHEVREGRAAQMPEYAVSPDAFRRQVAELVDAGYSLVTLSEAVERWETGSTEPTAVVTFDDALASLAEDALPTLRQHEARATIYVPTRWAGSPAAWLATAPAIMSAAMLRSLAADGFEIGGHSHSHLHLDLLTRSQLREEIGRNKRALESMLGVEVGSFAYPHGSHDRRVRDVVAATGFRSACAVNGPVLGATGDRYRIGRIVMHDSSDLASALEAQSLLGKRHPRGRDSVRTATLRHAYRTWRRVRLSRPQRQLAAGAS